MLTTTCSVLPLSFGRESTPCPFGKGFSTTPRHKVYGIVFFTCIYFEGRTILSDFRFVISLSSEIDIAKTIFSRTVAFGIEENYKLGIGNFILPHIEILTKGYLVSRGCGITSHSERTCLHKDRFYSIFLYRSRNFSLIVPFIIVIIVVRGVVIFFTSYNADECCGGKNSSRIFKIFFHYV